jgi:hypothetical protein
MWCAGIAGKAVERGLEFPIFNTYGVPFRHLEEKRSCKAVTA